MKTLYKKSVLARELPLEWQEEGRLGPEDRVTVWIEPEDQELARVGSLRELMDVIGRRAEQRGLSEEKLAEILNGR
jgi:hypothetical protein